MIGYVGLWFKNLFILLLLSLLFICEIFLNQFIPWYFFINFLILLYPSELNWADSGSLVTWFTSATWSTLASSVLFFGTLSTSLSPFLFGTFDTFPLLGFSFSSDIPQTKSPTQGTAGHPEQGLPFVYIGLLTMFPAGL